MISDEKTYGQKALETNRMGRTTEEVIEEMNFKFICEDCRRKLPYRSSLATHQQLHCNRSKCNCPDISSVLAIRKHDDQGRYGWNLFKVVTVSTRAEMGFSVVYYDGEPTEALKLYEEEWGIISFAEKRTVPSREQRIG